MLSRRPGSLGRLRPLLVLGSLAAAVLLGCATSVRPADGGSSAVQPTEPAASVSPSAAPTPPPAVTTQPSESPIPSPTGSAAPYAGLPAVPAALRVDRFAQVVTNDLAVRSRPSVGSDSVILDHHLGVGDRLFLGAGPIQASGYTWYAAQAVGPYRDEPFGWVASASRGGEPWLVGLDLACPSPPVTIEQLAAMFDLERVACFGDTSLSFEAYAWSMLLADLPMGWWGTPAWLNPLVHTRFVEGGFGHQMAVVYDPRANIAETADEYVGDYPPGNGIRYRITGHFDDPGSASCRGGGTDPVTGSRYENPPELMRLLCRAEFVVTARERLGGDST